MGPGGGIRSSLLEGLKRIASDQDVKRVAVGAMTALSLLIGSSLSWGQEPSPMGTQAQIIFEDSSGAATAPLSASAGVDCGLLEYSPLAATPWQLIFRAGPQVPLSEGFFENRTETGWMAAAAIRQPIHLPGVAWETYGEIGLTHAVVDGDGTTDTLPGVIIIPIPSPQQGSRPLGERSVFVANGFSASLVEIRRWSVDFAVGVRRPAIRFHQLTGYEFALESRAGFRVGGINPRLRLQPTDTLLRTVEESRGTVNPFTLRIEHGVKDPEVFVGVFGSLGVTVGVVEPWGMPFSVRLGLEAVFGADFFDTGSLAPGDHRLGTITPLATLIISR